MDLSTPATMIYTIGHSNQSMESFINLLLLHKIEVVADVRSHPFPRYAKQFDTDSMRDRLIKSGLKYVFLGREIGGMPKDEQFYDADGNVLYGKLAARPEFQNGISRLVKGTEKYRIALCCAEENPSGCHRRHLIPPALVPYGISVLHIRGSGELHSDEDLLEAAAVQNPVEQLRLF